MRNIPSLTTAAVRIVDRLDLKATLHGQLTASTANLSKLWNASNSLEEPFALHGIIEAARAH